MAARDIRRLAGAGALVIAVVAVVVLVSGSRKGHTLELVASDARFLDPGAEVRIAGRPVGQVDEAELTPAGHARLRLRITGDHAWPLPKGTRARFRWASTIAFSNRYVDLVPPARRGPSMADGATIPADDVRSTVELDQLFRVFDPNTRSDLKATLDRGGPAVLRAAPHLRDALDVAPPAVRQASAVLGDLGADRQRLGQLVTSADTVAHAVRVADPGVDHVVTGAARTFGAIASRDVALRRVLGGMPSTLAQARGTLSRADGTLRRADTVTQRLAPGVGELQRLVGPLDRTLSTLVAVGPDARSTLTSLRDATPDLNPFLAHATQLMPVLASLGEQARTQVGCVRPFAPDIAGFFTDWTAFTKTSDGQDKAFRANATTYPFESANTLNSAQITKTFPGLKFAFPIPPGQMWGQPWFQPQCHLGPETLDPAQDPEAQG